VQRRQATQKAETKVAKETAGLKYGDNNEQERKTIVAVEDGNIEVHRMMHPEQHPPPCPSSVWNCFTCEFGAPGRPAACSLLYFRISRTSSVKASSTLIRFFAEVSINRQPNLFASCSPAADDTWRWSFKSDLFAINTTGKESLSFTRKICCWNVVISSKDVCELMAYTSRKPSPVRIYCSRITEYSSWPAVSSTSSNATSSSITHCFRYESSIVGSYSSTKWL